jgi:hypothetical protein
MKREVRFWIIGATGSPVRLKLAYGSEVGHYRYERTEEGWTTEIHTYQVDTDGTVESTYASDGVDCDGRLQGGNTCVCPPDQLEGRKVDAMFSDHPEIRGFPCWTRVDDWQRDHQAEAAGY